MSHRTGVTAGVVPHSMGTGDPAPERGSTLLEFALTIPVVLSLVLGTVDLGLAIFTQTLLNNAAREAARVAITTSDDDWDSTTYAEACAVAVEFAAGFDLHQCHIVSQAGLVTVRLKYKYKPLTPLIARLLDADPNGDHIIMLRAVSTMHREGVDPTTEP